MVGAVVMESTGNEAADGAGGGGAARSKPAELSWLSVKSWDQLLAYEATLGTAFAGLPGAIESASQDWKVKQLVGRKICANPLLCMYAFNRRLIWST